MSKGKKTLAGVLLAPVVVFVADVLYMGGGFTLEKLPLHISLRHYHCRLALDGNRRLESTG